MRHAFLRMRTIVVRMDEIHFRCLYRCFRQVPLIGIWGAINYSLLMVLSQYGYDQCVPATTGLNKMEDLVQDPRFWKKLEEI
ncbi:hypothetical protein Goshw_027947 [Gossypium schwendimanii]|uniref:Uncharacterized protein n=1 Tax=Gossypium schwendimanii TaxID=34291 RepID=A0A7J9LCG0_GOSSC|nr:hypothetical protein [Gossypium schwendimanii]